MSNQSNDFKGFTLSAPYSILTYDKLQYEKDWESILHTHPYSEMLIVTNGHGFFTNGAKRTHIKCGHVVITNKFIPHTEFPYNADADYKSMEYAVLSLQNICFYIGNDYTKNTEESLILDMTSIWNQIANCLQKLDNEIEHKQPYWEILCKSIMDELIVIIMREAHLNNFYYDNEQPAQKIISAIKKTKHFMERHYQDKITLEDLANKVFLNKYYLSHSFKKYEGISPMQYLTQVRIKKAQSLLNSTDFSIMDIAMQTGFTSAANFCKIFKYNIGYSPLQYKNIFFKSIHTFK